MTFYVYLIRGSKATKIGISSDPQSRLSALQTSHYEPLHIYCTFRCENKFNAAALEQTLHKRYSSLCMRGEWFDIDPKVVVQDVLASPELRIYITGHEIAMSAVQKISDYLVNTAITDKSKRRKTDFIVASSIAITMILLSLMAFLAGVSLPTTVIFTLILLGFGLVFVTSLVIAKAIYDRYGE